MRPGWDKSQGGAACRGSLGESHLPVKSRDPWARWRWAHVPDLLPFLCLLTWVFTSPCPRSPVSVERGNKSTWLLAHGMI